MYYIFWCKMGTTAMTSCCHSNTLVTPFKELKQLTEVFFISWSHQNKNIVDRKMQKYVLKFMKMSLFVLWFVLILKGLKWLPINAWYISTLILLFSNSWYLFMIPLSQKYNIIYVKAFTIKAYMFFTCMRS